jgi:hypothetical protein
MWGWTLILLTIGLIIVIWDSSKHQDSEGSVLTIIGIFIILFSWLSGLFLGSFLPVSYTDHDIETIKLVNLRNSQDIQGSLFLGTGHISGTERYVFYSEINNGYVLNTILAKEVIIYEENRNDGILLKKTDSIPGNAFHFSKSQQSFEFHIPKDSIDRSFKLE